MEALLQERRLLYVTGKGGVGKTTVAAAIGLAAAQSGRRTIVCEVAEQDRVSRAFRREGVTAETEVLLDRKSTRLNSSHMSISYAVFCLKKKKVTTILPWSTPKP